MNSASPEQLLSEEDRTILLAVARTSIEQGLDSNLALVPDLLEYPETLHPLRATFVTLELDHRLQGCIGCLEASRPLVEDVAHHAFAAAFEDPRFPRLRRWELSGVDVHISVLSEPMPLPIRHERDLLASLQPGVDGLILRYREHRATFLPAVWDSLSEPREFLQHLKRKAGLPGDFWSSELRFERYTTEAFP